MNVYFLPQISAGRFFVVPGTIINTKENLCYEFVYRNINCSPNYNSYSVQWMNGKNGYIYVRNIGPSSSSFLGSNSQ